jgi:hypothetical protein
MLHSVVAQILRLSWPGSLVPIRRDQQPSSFPDLGQEGSVVRANIRQHILFVNPIPNPGSIENSFDFGAIEILIQVERGIPEVAL